MQLLPERVPEVTAEMLGRAEILVASGLGAADAVHVAAAEALGADVLLTCDDRLVRRCRSLADRCTVRVKNPVPWIEEQSRDQNA